jgi:hypothetical protein
VQNATAHPDDLWQCVVVIQNSENTRTTKTDDFVFAEPFGRFYAKTAKKSLT